jgi:aspartyl-tRNA synthetase
MSNVVQFPGAKRNTPPQNIEEVKSNLDAVRQVHVEEAMSLIATVLFDNMAVAGFSFDAEDNESIKDVALLLESLRSLLSKYHNIDHPFQLLSEELFTLQENGTVICSKQVLDMLVNGSELEDA